MRETIARVSLSLSISLISMKQRRFSLSYKQKPVWHLISRVPIKPSQSQGHESATETLNVYRAGTKCFYRSHYFYPSFQGPPFIPFVASYVVRNLWERVHRLSFTSILCFVGFCRKIYRFVLSAFHFFVLVSEKGDNGCFIDLRCRLVFLHGDTMTQQT